MPSFSKHVLPITPLKRVIPQYFNKIFIYQKFTYYKLCASFTKYEDKITNSKDLSLNYELKKC